MKAALVALLADEAPVPRIATHKWPKDWTLDEKRPLVLIADDPGDIDWPVKSEHIIRITVGSDDVPTSSRIARRCLGHILANLPEGLAAIQPFGTAITRTQHRATGADLASGTVNVVIRTEIIA
ncbi:hypothetical protein H7J75_08945 [Mycolicibacterium canariasense]|uniref:hypothetical protein n=1 Tax=Mycolicibacterium canariasense TaxID=228230 RepID=UPI000788F25E|nr:hypothetical protein [Mycolicibacterium canariasense]MCV7208787.1 hypothetical protein [Mycolicibacterium canariasense]ORV07146.1 hypothetical protein AWB94_14185 [Mycolicibacterium canariasense]